VKQVFLDLKSKFTRIEHIGGVHNRT